MSSENATATEESEAAVAPAPLVDDIDLVSGISGDEFRRAFRNHAAGVAVITADAGEGPVALTATSVFSVSATPPLLVFSVSSLSSAASTLLAAPSLVVHLLDTADVALARLCSTSGVDRFADASSWGRLPTGEPYYLAPRIHLRGVIVNLYEAGTSTLVVVNVTHVTSPALDSEVVAAPLVYHSRTWLALNRSEPLD